MTKLASALTALACICVLTGILLVPQTVALTTYYSNSFDSAALLNDGYWTLHDASVQTLNNKSTLKVDGEASFTPAHGDFDPNNFTVQYDVYHNVVYENNSAYQGSFYEAADSQGNVIIRMGYVEKGTNNNVQQMGFVSFAAGPNGETYSHYYFPFNHSADWSTWSLTLVIEKTEGPYLANASIQVNGEAITTFDTGRPNPDGSGQELWVSNITNEQIYNPIAYHNLLPLPQAGGEVPTFPPTQPSYATSGIHYDLLSARTQLASVSGATASYIDNFYYGYANTVPTSHTPSATPTTTTEQTPATTLSPTTNPTNSNIPEIPQPFTTILSIALIMSIALGILLYLKKNKRNLA